MSFNLKNRSFLTLRDFTPAEIKFLLTLSAELKAAKYAGTEQQRLKGKSIDATMPLGPWQTLVVVSIVPLIQSTMLTATRWASHGESLRP